MIKRLLRGVWLNVPPRLRRLTMRLTNTRFTVTAGGIVINAEGQVLLVKHIFRAGTGWGIPGSFTKRCEQPIEGCRRELREEIGLERDEIALFEARSFKRPRQVELLYLCRTTSQAEPKSVEVDRAAWFSTNSLPTGLPKDQRLLVERAVGNGAK